MMRSIRSSLEGAGIAQGSQSEIADPAPTISSLTAIKTKIAQGAEDTSILFIGDSTSNETSEWIYLFAVWLGEEYPTHSVIYRHYDTSTESYSTPITVSSGTGPRTLHIWNNSYAGGRISDRMGSRYATSIATVSPAPDLIWINDGVNRASEDSPSLVKAVLLEAMQQIQIDHPGTPFALIYQNPFRDNDDMNSVFEGLRGAAEHYPGITAVDIHSRFLEAGKSSSLFADSVHPSNAGQALILEDVQRHWLAARDLPPLSSFAPWVGDDRGYFNLIDNGDFSAWSDPNAPPDGFSESESDVVGHETSIVFPGKSASVSISGTGSRYMEWNAPADVLDTIRGKRVTLAIRKYVPTGGHDATGRVLLQWDGYNSSASVDASSINANYSRDGWFWQFMTGNLIPRDVSSFRARFYQFDNDTFFIDEVLLYEGDGKPAQAR